MDNGRFIRPDNYTRRKRDSSYVAYATKALFKKVYPTKSINEFDGQLFLLDVRGTGTVAFEGDVRIASLFH
jgi:hypothetical protein